MTKYRDIAVLMAMGARRAQIRTIFVLQGAMIGVVGTAIGLRPGYTICYFADKYRWVPLNESVYALSFVPFEPQPWDGVWIAAAAHGGESAGHALPGAQRHPHHSRRGLTIRMMPGRSQKPKQAQSSGA